MDESGENTEIKKLIWVVFSLNCLKALFSVTQLLISEIRRDAFEDNSGLSQLEYYVQRFGHESYWYYFVFTKIIAPCAVLAQGCFWPDSP